MKKRYIYFTVIATAVIIPSLVYLANRFVFTAKNPLREDIVKRLNDTNWQERDRAVNELISHKELLQDKKIVDQVIELLNREVSENRKLEEGNNTAIELHAKQYGEGYGEYFIDILDVARNINDKRVIPCLIDSIGWGPAVENKLASFGEQTIDLIIGKFKMAQDTWDRVGCINVLYLIDKQSISNDSKEKIRQFFLDALKDESNYVSNAAQKALKD